MPDTGGRRRMLWRRILLGLSLLMAAQGVSWMVFGSFDPFGFHDGLMAESLLGGEMTAEVDAYKRFILIPFGATDAAYFGLFAYVVKFGLLDPDADHRTWFRALPISLAIWFVLDTVGCMLVGAWFNIWVVNIPCVLLFAAPLWGARP